MVDRHHRLQRRSVARVWQWDSRHGSFQSPVVGGGSNRSPAPSATAHSGQSCTARGRNLNVKTLIIGGRHKRSAPFSPATAAQNAASKGIPLTLMLTYAWSQNKTARV